MSNEDRTDPGLLEKAKNWTKDADAPTDRLLGRIQGSEWSAAIVALIVLAIIGAGMWAAW